MDLIAPGIERFARKRACLRFRITAAEVKPVNRRRRGAANRAEWRQFGAERFQPAQIVVVVKMQRLIQRDSNPASRIALARAEINPTATVVLPAPLPVAPIRIRGVPSALAIA